MNLSRTRDTNKNKKVPKLSPRLSVICSSCYGQQKSYDFVVAKDGSGDNFTTRNITFENSAGDVDQAVVLQVDGDKAVFVNCRFLGFQATFYTDADDS